ncbi:MAG: hypothetical protein INQ03_13165 [Candidatus Heimdallarchaeota archaeon]|nr:hypothetical protein [Candidatus Heimdallarchaeota archaeon]
MTDDQKIKIYQNLAKSLTENDLHRISEFYETFEIGDEVDLKHRYIKLFAVSSSNREGLWLRLDKYCNKRRINNKDLGKLIRAIIEKGVYPIRLFHSVSEWLDPRAVIHGNKQARMLRSGMMVYENDESLNESLLTAQELNSKLSGEKYFVYSGNKSIHVWWLSFNPLDYIDIDIEDFWKRREYYDRVARFKAYESMKKQTSFSLDKRVSIDSRRIVPIIGSLNAITGRTVQRITKLEIDSIDLMSIFS